MRSLWFENLVADAMSNEACCLLKANMSGDKHPSFGCRVQFVHAHSRAEDAISFFKSRGTEMNAFASPAFTCRNIWPNNCCNDCSAIQACGRSRV